ncbi:MAG: hypothetical protein QXS03_02835 [Candidatus Micrarchaeaceae archaeon]
MAGNVKIKKKRIDGWNILLIIAIVVLAAIVIAFIPEGNGGNVAYVQLEGHNLTIVKVGGVQYALALVNASNNIAYISIQNLPVLASEPMLVSIKSGSGVAINTAQNGSYANLEIKVSSLSGNTASIEVVAVNSSLLIPITSSGQQSSTVASTTSTTIHPSNSTTSTTSSTVTSSSIPVNTTAQAMGILERNSNYTIIEKYASYYGNIPNCSSSLYNQTYIMKHGTAPQGGATYSNVASTAPSALKFGLYNMGGGKFNATFSAVLNGQLIPSATFIININNGTVVGSLNGIYAGSTFAQLAAMSKNITSIGNACGILVV